jgi:predicted phosphodiesterase
MTQKELAKQYRDKFGKDYPTLSLARIMYKENIEIFTNVESARSALRFIEGKSGNKKNRKAAVKSKYFMAEERPKNPWKLPPSEEQVYQPYIIKGISKLVVLSDLHIPYHSIDAISAVLDWIQANKPDGILINGDLIDFYQFSRFQKDPRKRSAAHELRATNEFLDILSQFGAKIFLKLGNHDERYENYMMLKAPELLGIPEFELTNLLKLKERGVELIDKKRIVKANALNILHGHEFGQSIFSPVNVARGLFLRGKVSAMQGHNHQSSSHTESNLNGEIVTTYSLGCLCELNPAYLPINKWNHGFAVVLLNKNGKNFEVYNHTIYHGKIF